MNHVPSSTRRLFGSFIVAILAALAVGCGISDPSNNTVDTYTGTVQVGGYVYQEFSVGSDGGEVEIKITAITPDSGATLGLLYGQINSGSVTNCTAIVQSLGTQGRTAISNRIARGTFCLVVYDPGGGLITRAETYTIEVSHP